jgi:hypothetical protein
MSGDLKLVRRAPHARKGLALDRNKIAAQTKRRSDRTGSICDHQYDVTDVAHPQALRLRRTASRLRGLTAHNIRNQKAIEIAKHHRNTLDNGGLI